MNQTHSDNMLMTIYWMCNPMEKRAIIERHAIPRYTTINGETPVNADEALLEDLMRYEARGMIELRQGKKALYDAFKELTQKR